MDEDETKLYPLRKKVVRLPSSYRGAVEEILREGMNRVYPEFFDDERETLDMGDVKTSWKIEKAQEQIHELVKSLGVDYTLGFDWEKKKLKY